MANKHERALLAKYKAHKFGFFQLSIRGRLTAIGETGAGPPPEHVRHLAFFSAVYFFCDSDNMTMFHMLHRRRTCVSMAVFYIKYKTSLYSY